MYHVSVYFILVKFKNADDATMLDGSYRVADRAYQICSNIKIYVKKQWNEQIQKEFYWMYFAQNIKVVIKIDGGELFTSKLLL